MIWIEKSLALVAGFCLLTSAAQAISDDAASQERNYRVIIDRNVFGLKPPPPPPTNAPVVVAPPKDEILLTGITTIGTPRAYFATKAPQGKDPEKYSLGVDERKNALEVLAIDKAGVRVRNAGLETVMTFASNGVKPPASPTPPPGAPGNPQGNPDHHRAGQSRECRCLHH